VQSQTLLIDADDTLWENNIYFERAIAAFSLFLRSHCEIDTDIRPILNQCEHANIAVHGYGVLTFERSLIDCFTLASGAPPTPDQRRLITDFAKSISDQSIELIPGVSETLCALARRHRLFLVTKGNVSEQKEKLERSGVHMHFTAVEIPSEKHPSAYREILERHRLSSKETWMIGNSPRSDINPALAAGLHAAYIPHPNTWVLEHEELAHPTPPQQLLHLSSFAALSDYF
jgi:putative hydrolase of the HAD superfamily